MDRRNGVTIPYDFNHFIKSYDGVVDDLKKSLRRSFFQNTPPKKDVIGQVVHNVLDLHHEGKYELRDVELLRLRMLAKNLNEVGAYDRKLLKHFRRRINRGGFNEYSGTRMEISIAARLIRERVIFDHNEGIGQADFSVKYLGKHLNIECTSICLSEDKDKDVMYKFPSAINHKAKKDYCNPTTALFLDFTNVYHHSVPTPFNLSNRDVRSYIQPLVKGTNFGSVINFTYIAGENAKFFEHIFLRVDNDRIDAGLKTFLNRFYPFGSHRVMNYQIPLTG